ATKLYYFVHKVPVCGNAYVSQNTKYVRTYLEWVIDDWPPKCYLCHAAIEEGTNPQTTQLGCLYIIDTSCLDSHIKGFPPHTTPAGYTCPTCSAP
ncbi:Zinc finger protein-like 1, partial [Camellia lanceoleosa]